MNPSPESPTAAPAASPETSGVDERAWHAARHGAVLCDASVFGVIEAEGADAESFLHGQLSSDVAALPPGGVQWSSYNSPKGRMLASVALARDPLVPDRFRLLAAADLTAALAKRLSMFVLRAKVRIVDRTAAVARLGVGGPQATAAVAAALGRAPAPGGVAADGDTQLVGLPDGRILVLAPIADVDRLRERLAAHAIPAPPGVLAWLGIRAGVPLVTAATQDQLVLQMANLDALGGVSFRKGCYPGQEIVARMQYLGRLKERMHAFDADVPPPAAGTRLYGAAFGDQACGLVVNAAPAPGGGAAMLATVQLEALAAGELRLGSPDGPALRRADLPYAIPEPQPPRGRIAGAP